jgi:ABC-type hemin transport system ATPase subunit
MSSGEIIADGGSKQIFDSDALERAYGCPIEVINAGGRKFAVTHLEKTREEG